jgi:DHA2 family multidrug resistance protein-like MFS transporter
VEQRAVAGEVPARATQREWIGLGVLTLAALVYAMDLTVLNLAIPRISAELRPSSVQLLWIIDIYGFLVAGLLITMGTLGDRIGRRKLLLGGAAGFALASLLAAFSQSAEMLIVSRAVMGIAGATVAPSTLSLIFTMFRDTRQRSTAISVWIAAYSVGSAIGPVIGGVLLQFFWWGSVFLIGVPVMSLLLLLGPRTLPEYRDPEARRLDLRSAAMSLMALLAVVYGLKQVAQDGFSPMPLLVIVGGVILGVLFVRRQQRLESPIIDVGLFRIRAFTASLGAYLLAIFVVIGYFLFISQYLQLVLGLSPLEAGLWSLPSSAGFIVGSITAPRIIHRFRPSVVMGVGMTVAAIGTMALLALGIGGMGNLFLVVAASIVIDLGLAPVIQLATELIVGSAPPEQAGAATGVSETSGELGGALGIAVLGSIGTAVYRAGVADGLPPALPAGVGEAARDTLGGALTVAQGLPGALAERVVAAAQLAFMDGLHLVAAVAAVSAIVTAIAAAVALRSVPKRSDVPPTAE